MLRELLASFTVDGTQAEAGLRKLDAQVTKVVGAIGGLAEAFVGSALVHGMGEFIAHQIEAGSRVNDLSERLGVGVEELQAFQFAAGLAGVGAEDAAKGLQFLSKNVGEAIGGNKEAVETFAKLGVTLKGSNGEVRETGDLMPEIADAFEKMGSDAERTATAMKLFGKSGAALIPLLKGGSAEAKKMFGEFQRLGGGMSKEFVAAADKAGDEIDKLKFAMGNWRSQIAFAILPAVTRGAQKLQDWVVKLQKLTKETNLAKYSWAAMGTGAAAALFKMAAGFTKLLGLVPKGGSFWQTLLGMGELGLIIAGIGLLVLAFDDLYTWLSGGESIIGDIIDGLFGVGSSKDVIEEVSKIFSEFMTEFSAFKPIIEEFGRLFVAAFKMALPYLVAIEKDNLQRMAAALVGIIKFVRMLTEELGAGLELFGRFATGAGNVMSKLGMDSADDIKRIGSSFETTGQGLQKVVEASRATSVPTSAFLGGEVARRNGDMYQQNSIEVNVQGGKNPQETGEAVKNGVKNALDQTDLQNAYAATESGY